MSTTKSNKDGERTQQLGAYCPKGKYSYSQHRMKEIQRTPVRPGVVQSTRECKICGGIDQVIMDWNALAGIF